MANEVYPIRAPAPNAPVHFDGSDWRVPLVDTAGRQQVRGEDQLFSYKGQFARQYYDGAAAAGKNTFDTETVPAGEVWVVTGAMAFDFSSACTYVYIGVRRGGTIYQMRILSSPAAFEAVHFSGHFYAVEDDDLYVEFEGVTAGDALIGNFWGYRMTLEV